MAMIRLIWLGIFLLVLSACGGRTVGNSEITQDDAFTAGSYAAPIRELYEFPGSISGFTVVNGRFILTSQEVCINLPPGTIDETSESPLTVTLANERLTVDEFFFELDEELNVERYCFNPILGEGVYNIDIELIISGELELYAFNFNSTLPNPFRLTQYPHEFIGLTLMTREEREQLPDIAHSVRYRLDIDTQQLCIWVADEDVIGGEIIDNVSIALDGRLLTEEQLIFTLDDDGGLFCLNTIPDAGLHTLYILVNAVASVPPSQLAFQGDFIVLTEE